MKKLIILLILLSGCSYKTRELAEVQRQFPGAEIVRLADSGHYLVREKSGAVWLVEMEGFSPTNVTGKAILFQPLR